MDILITNYECSVDTINQPIYSSSGIDFKTSIHNVRSRIAFQGEALVSAIYFEKMMEKYNGKFSLHPDHNFSITSADEMQLLLSELSDIKKLLPTPEKLHTTCDKKSMFSLLLSEIIDIKNALKQIDNSDRK